MTKGRSKTRSDSTESWATKKNDEEITDIYRGRTTKHQLGRTKLRYEAIADRVVLRKREKPIARIFHVAYLAQSRAARPLTFVFNGGPGAASAYLHMWALGPQRAVFNEDGTSHMIRPVQLAVNIIIYALTQKGSITQRLMQMVN